MDLLQGLNLQPSILYDHFDNYQLAFTQPCVTFLFINFISVWLHGWWISSCRSNQVRVDGVLSLLSLLSSPMQVTAGEHTRTDSSSDLQTSQWQQACRILVWALIWVLIHSCLNQRWFCRRLLYKRILNIKALLEYKKLLLQLIKFEWLLPFFFPLKKVIWLPFEFWQLVKQISLFKTFRSGILWGTLDGWNKDLLFYCTCYDLLQKNKTNAIYSLHQTDFVVNYNWYVYIHSLFRLLFFFYSLFNWCNCRFWCSICVFISSFNYVSWKEKSTNSQTAPLNLELMSQSLSVVCKKNLHTLGFL